MMERQLTSAVKHVVANISVNQKQMAASVPLATHTVPLVNLSEE
jgi:hypothetical protein